MNVHLIENIFSNDKRRQLIEYSKPLLLENSILWSKYPGGDTQGGNRILTFIYYQLLDLLLNIL